MNVISNTLISIKSDSGIVISSSITTALDSRSFEITIDGHERELSIETVDELLEALHKLKDLSNHVN
jgi:hypothetical protein